MRSYKYRWVLVIIVIQMISFVVPHTQVIVSTESRKSYRICEIKQ